MLRVPADFNTMDWDPEERVWINTARHRNLADQFRHGLIVLLYDTDFEVEATVEQGGETAPGSWFARPEWATRRDIPCQE